MAKKWCSRCGEMRPTGEFGLNASTLGGLADLCREHQNEAHRKSYAKRNLTEAHVLKADRRRKALSLVLIPLAESWMNVACADCGDLDRPRRLRYPVGSVTTNHSPVTMARLGYAPETIKAWIEKGTIVCSRCHRLSPGERSNRVRASDIPKATVIDLPLQYSDGEVYLDDELLYSADT